MTIFTHHGLITSLILQLNSDSKSKEHCLKSSEEFIRPMLVQRIFRYPVTIKK